MAELARVNADYAMPYGADAGMDEVRSLIRETFDAEIEALRVGAVIDITGNDGPAAPAEPPTPVFSVPVSERPETAPTK